MTTSAKNAAAHQVVSGIITPMLDKAAKASAKYGKKPPVNRTEYVEALNAQTLLDKANKLGMAWNALMDADGQPPASLSRKILAGKQTYVDVLKTIENYAREYA